MNAISYCERIFIGYILCEESFFPEWRRLPIGKQQSPVWKRGKNPVLERFLKFNPRSL
jgi:hypothetical protein